MAERVHSLSRFSLYFARQITGQKFGSFLVLANDFCKIIVPCDPSFVAFTRRRKSRPADFQQVRFSSVKERFCRARIYFAIVTCILPRDWGVVASSVSRIGRLRFYRSRHSILQICYYYRLVQTFMPTNAQITQQSLVDELLNLACASWTL